VDGATTERLNLVLTRRNAATEGELRELLFTPPAGSSWRLIAPASFVIDRGEAVEIEPVTLRSENQQLALRGRLALRGKNDASLALNHLELGPLCAAADLPDCDGQLSGRVAVAGSAAAPALQGAFNAAALRLDAVDAYADRRMTMEAALRAPVAGTLDVNGTVPIDLAWAGERQDVARAPMSVRIQSQELDLAFLQVVAPRQVRAAAGRVAVDLHLTGSRAAPHAEGYVILDDGHLELVSVGVPYRELRARIAAAGNRFRLTELRARAGEGTLEGSGWVDIDLAERARFSLVLRLDDFLAVRNWKYEAAVSGDVTAEGTPAAPEVTADLDVTRAVVRPAGLTASTAPTPEPDPTIEIIGVPESETPPEEPRPGLVDRLRLTANVRIARNAWIRREDANIELAGEVRLEKAPYEALRTRGRITLVRGWYAFQGRKFKLTEGAISLSETDADPHVNVTASYRASEYTIVVKVSGPSSKPALDLSSDPPLEKADILSVLLFGKPTGQLTGGQAAGLQEQTMRLAGGYMVGPLSTSVRDTLGLDSLEVGVPQGSEGSGHVTVGRYVTEDVFISFAQEFGASTGETVSAEYGITQNISVRGSTSTLGNSAVDIFWSRRY
jgi:translocation and assembly module TamB